MVLVNRVITTEDALPTKKMEHQQSKNKRSSTETQIIWKTGKDAIMFVSWVFKSMKINHSPLSLKNGLWMHWVWRASQDFFTIERAHRIPSRSTSPGSNPRPTIIKLINYRDRDLILSKVRQ